MGISFANQSLLISGIKEGSKKKYFLFQPDFIFHLAAQPLVRQSYKEPLYTFEVNVAGTANLLDAVKELNKLCSVVIITTDKVYENIEQHYAYKEMINSAAMILTVPARRLRK